MDNNSVNLPPELAGHISQSLMRIIAFLQADVNPFKWEEERGINIRLPSFLAGDEQASVEFKKLMISIKDMVIQSWDIKAESREGRVVDAGSLTLNFIQLLMNLPEVKNAMNELLRKDIALSSAKRKLSFDNVNPAQATLKLLSSKIGVNLHKHLMATFCQVMEGPNRALESAGLPTIQEIVCIGDSANDDVMSTFSSSEAGSWMTALDYTKSPDRIKIAVRRCEAMIAFPSVFPVQSSIMRINPAMSAIHKAIDNGKPYGKLLQIAFHLPKSSYKALSSLSVKKLYMAKAAGSKRLFNILPHHKGIMINDSRVYRAASLMLKYNLPVTLYPKTADEWTNSPFIHVSNYSYLRPDIMDACLQLPIEERVTGLGENKQVVQSGGWNNDLMDGLRELVSRVYEPLIMELSGINPDFKNFVANRPSDGVRDVLHEGVPEVSLLFTDFICRNRSPQRIVELLWKLHRDIADLACIDREYETGISSWPALTAPTTSGDYEIVPLVSPSDLILEGKDMHHCVGTYAPDCLKGTSHIFSFRKHVDGQLVSCATVEVKCEIGTQTQAHYRESLRIQQVRGPWNASIKKDSETLKVIKQWIADIRTGKLPIMKSTIRLAHEEVYEAAVNEKTAAMQSLSKGEMDERTREKYEKCFPVFQDFLPGARGKGLFEWGHDSGIMNFVSKSVKCDVQQPEQTPEETADNTFQP